LPRNAINSSGYSLPIEGFSQTIVANTPGRFVFVSGLTARSADGTIVAVGDLRGQVRQVMENLQTVLGAAGATLDDVVQIHTYVRDITDFEPIEFWWRQYWGDVWPASTLVQIVRLFDERQLIEIEATAFVPGGDA
jgi:2-iminobutanoate/2-iminopropanoate deaminase